MKDNKIEEIKKLVKPIQDFIASNTNIDNVKIEINKIVVESSEILEIRTHNHKQNDEAIPSHTFSCK